VTSRRSSMAIPNEVYVSSYLMHETRSKYRYTGLSCCFIYFTLYILRGFSAVLCSAGSCVFLCFVANEAPSPAVESLLLTTVTEELSRDSASKSRKTITVKNSSYSEALTHRMHVDMKGTS